MKNPRFAPLLALACVASAATTAPAIDIGDRKQLFIDHRFIRGASGIELKMNPPVKEGPVLLGDRSWDSYNLSSYGSVLEDNGKYRMWYGARSPFPPGFDDHVRDRICYAESEDGRHWIKPSLGLFEWRGSRANNILMLAMRESAAVFIDPKAPAAERYRIVGHCHARSERSPDGEGGEGTGLYMYTSPDGLRWTLHPTRVFPFDPDTLNMALSDRRTGRYLAYVRTWNPLRRVGVVVIDDIMRPWPYDRSVPSRQGRHPGVPFGPETAPSREIPDAFGTDAGDPPNLDFYTSAVVEYPWADDAYLMFPSAYRHFPEPPVGRFRNSGLLDIDLAVSRDGLKFHRISREPYIRLGEEGSIDSRGLYMLVGMFCHDGRIYQYYAGHDIDHGDVRTLGGANHSAIFLVVQRLDGFVSADAGPEGGRFSTPTLAFRGNRLVLNLDASAVGEVEVEIRDPSGQPLPGRAFADCDPLFGNNVAETVTWRKGDGDLSALSGRPVQLAFRLRSAKLYAFQFPRIVP